MEEELHSVKSNSKTFLWSVKLNIQQIKFIHHLPQTFNIRFVFLTKLYQRSGTLLKQFLKFET